MRGGVKSGRAHIDRRKETGFGSARRREVDRALRYARRRGELAAQLLLVADASHELNPIDLDHQVRALEGKRVELYLPWAEAAHGHPPPASRPRGHRAASIAVEAEACEQREVVEGLEQHVVTPCAFELELRCRDRRRELGAESSLALQELAPARPDLFPVHRLETGPRVAAAVKPRSVEADQVGRVRIAASDGPHGGGVETGVPLFVDPGEVERMPLGVELGRGVDLGPAEVVPSGRFEQRVRHGGRAVRSHPPRPRDPARMRGVVDLADQAPASVDPPGDQEVSPSRSTRSVPRITAQRWYQAVVTTRSTIDSSEK